MESWLEPLHDAETMRAVDAWAIEERAVPSLELMEAAGRAVAEAAEQLAGPGPARVVCGKGNNGGDGLVAARHLAGAGHEVEVLLLSPPGELSADAKANLERFDGTVGEFDPAALDGSGVVVDAIFGTGFSGAARDPAAAAIAAINGCGSPVVAADIASGVDASTGEVAGPAVEATITVSFHAAKLGHWVAPGKRRTGKLRVAPIGIPDGAPSAAPGGLIHPSVLELLVLRGADSTKFSSGTVLVVGGSRGFTGSVCLAASAAARAGAGYVTVAVPAELEPIFETKLTEEMSIGCPGADGALGPEALEPILSAAERRAAVVLGPGLGRSEAAAELTRELVARIEAPLVLDADGLNALAGRLELLAGRAGPTVLTPHAGELGRLLDTESAEIGAHRLSSAREAAARAAAVVVLKGDDSIVAAPGEGAIVNGLSSPALATAGTGDVLSGMTAALIARGLDARTAAAAAVHAHTRAGRVAAARVGAAESVIAGDVIEAIPAGLTRDEGREP
ncbi:MAG: ADP-dependent NAD(P)H-hydrate dehydratase / NAD(P)H-hydrate epimerase [Solirubrobacterales bacterium]|jgi:NAD(P)H-hydrate epimerase|nr:ADP-dependent NAD(P)H-hydrate dehydratase / NAD(P)H-hydrate epimerase [Solirubrobacterales bacterium]